MKTRKNKFSFTGFTLFELVVVLAIISAMVAVTLPFCKRSNDGLKVRQAGSSIAQVLRYAIDLAEKRNEAVKFIFNEKYKSYYLAIKNSESNFEPLDDFTGKEQFLNENIQLFDIENFEQAGQDYFLVFAPEENWPNASITFSTSDLVVTIKIKSKYVEIQEESI